MSYDREDAVLKPQRGGNPQDRVLFIEDRRLGFLGPSPKKHPAAYRRWWWIAEFGPGIWRDGLAYSEDEAVGRILSWHRTNDELLTKKRSDDHASVVASIAGHDGDPVHIDGSGEAGESDHTETVGEDVPDRTGDDR